MEHKNFKKNDQGFICECCHKKIPPLGYTSRDHCPFCLTSLHVDIKPGDRQNACRGLLIPVDITSDSKKGYVINYVCSKCGEKHNNKVADDDEYTTILQISNKTYNVKEYMN